MADAAIHIIGSLRKKWIAAIWLSHLLTSLACSYCLSFCLDKFLGYPLLWGIPFCLIIFFLLLFFDRSWKIRDRDVAAFLNYRYPGLEESAELLLAPPSSLPLLQQLQVHKTELALRNIHTRGIFFKKLSASLLITLIAGIVVICLSAVHVHSRSDNKALLSPAPASTIKAEKLLPSISSFSVKIQPPPYTRKPGRMQERFNLEAEEGATLTWQIKTSLPVKTVQLILNDSKTLSLKPADEKHFVWTANKIINASGFYQVKMDTVVSELYKMEMLKDQPPAINVRTPKPTTIIDYGEPENIFLDVAVTDDYGIRDVSVAATISSGSGEAVKFEQKQIGFENSFALQSPQYKLKKNINLAAAGMKPGDDLYFYIKAVDNYGQEKRSDVYIVTITDTAQLMSVEGVMNGINIKPEYFRSQRQIIIETEQLIKEKGKLTEEEFKNKSNDLGIDQKLLRLRYGKFLGEEAESNEDLHLPTPGNDQSDFGNAEKVLDAYTDKHDNAEVADFFEIATKNQLKATLTEMWDAELKLRTFKPVEALPYEYKALRLLKDLQQKSRAYVAKTSFTTTPLKPEKRLTADLSKIIDPFRQHDIQQNTGKDHIVRNALNVLEQIKTGVDFKNNSLQVLQLAEQQLAGKAIVTPAVYLAALEAMKRIINDFQNRSVVNAADISLAGSALQKMADYPANLPFSNKKPANIQLSKEYFNNLNKIKPR